MRFSLFVRHVLSKVFQYDHKHTFLLLLLLLLFFFHFARFCIPKRCTHVHCLALKNNRIYVIFFMRMISNFRYKWPPRTMITLYHHYVNMLVIVLNLGIYAPSEKYLGPKQSPLNSHNGLKKIVRSYHCLSTWSCEVSTTLLIFTVTLLSTDEISLPVIMHANEIN